LSKLVKVVNDSSVFFPVGRNIGGIFEFTHSLKVIEQRYT
jgi:hypothetical protein